MALAVCKHPRKKVVAYGFCEACFKTWVSKRRPSELHGLTVEQACEMMANQGNECYLCQFSFGLSMPYLEHDHFTRRARGWACNKCNQSIAAANGSPYLLRRMADNLENPPGSEFFKEDLWEPPNSISATKNFANGPSSRLTLFVFSVGNGSTGT